MSELNHENFLRTIKAGNESLAGLMKELAVAPEVTVRGVVSPSGPGLSQSMGQPMWQFTMVLCPWRRDNEPLCHDKLTIRREYAEKDTSRAREGLDPCSVVALRVRLTEHSSFEGPQALLTKKLPKPSLDDELNAVAEELQRPKIVYDEQFGAFTLERRANWYRGNTHWGDVEVSLNLSTDSDDNVFPEDALSNARNFWSDQEEWSHKAGLKIVEELLGLKNSVWLRADESELSPQEFLRAVVIESITMNPKGEFSMWFDDGELFWGHSIEVWGNLYDGVKRADLQG